jgi:uncharacterized protein YndB with AHSA1/START domain
MTRIEARGTIAGAPQDVFDLWSDGRRFPSWKPEQVQRVDLLTAGPVGLHSRFRGTYKGLGEVEWEVVEYQPPRQVTTVAHTKFGDLRHTILLHEMGGVTQVTQVGDMKPKGIMRLLAPMIASSIRNGFEMDTRLLARHLTGAVSSA